MKDFQPLPGAGGREDHVLIRDLQVSTTKAAQVFSFHPGWHTTRVGGKAGLNERQ